MSTVRALSGDTVFTVAVREKVPVRALIESNSLSAPFTLTAGQMLLVPHTAYYTVQRGETLYGISRRFGVDLYTLAQANGISAPYRVDAGRRLRISSSPDLPPKLDSGTAAASPPVKNLPSTPPPPAIATRASEAVVPIPPARTERTFAWPVRGNTISSFGPKPGGLHNDGINIAVSRGTEVHAAENGVVVYAGNELRGYGKLLLVRHADGWMTAYAHNDALVVRRGETVKRGQVIARSGASGGVSSPQLHFEIRHGVQAVDPVVYLTPNA